MAEAATDESVNRGENIPDAAGALEIISEIHGLQSDQRSLAQNAGQLWKRVEQQCGLNQQGAKHFASILNKPVDKRKDEFRTFIMLSRQAGWFDWLTDLVDQAEGTLGFGGARAAPPAPAAPTPQHPSDDSDLAGASAAKPLLTVRVNLKSGWIQQVKPDLFEAQVANGGALDQWKEEDWEDVRQATPEELAAERNRIADFDDAPAAEAEPPKRGRGRPPGSKNRRPGQPALH